MYFSYFAFREKNARPRLNTSLFVQGDAQKEGGR